MRRASAHHGPSGHGRVSDRCIITMRLPIAATAKSSNRMSGHGAVTGIEESARASPAIPPAATGGARGTPMLEPMRLPPPYSRDGHKAPGPGGGGGIRVYQRSSIRERYVNWATTSRHVTHMCEGVS